MFEREIDGACVFRIDYLEYRNCCYHLTSFKSPNKIILDSLGVTRHPKIYGEVMEINDREYLV